PHDMSIYTKSFTSVLVCFSGLVSCATNAAEPDHSGAGGKADRPSAHNLPGIAQRCTQPSDPRDPSPCQAGLECVGHETLGLGMVSFCRDVLNQQPETVALAGLCDTTRDCVAGLVCAGGTDQLSSTCQPKSAQGGVCQFDDFGLGTDYDCQDGLI